MTYQKLLLNPFFLGFLIYMGLLACAIILWLISVIPCNGDEEEEENLPE